MKLFWKGGRKKIDGPHVKLWTYIEIVICEDDSSMSEKVLFSYARNILVTS